jgi:hypothetical protein
MMQGVSPVRIAPLLLVLLTGCFITDPRLPPFDPPPIVPAGVVVLEIPDSAARKLRRANVSEELQAALLAGQIGGASGGLREELIDDVLQQRVVTGMTVREVIYCFRSHPRRVRDQGPPGGHTLLWETNGLFVQRFWVRFDGLGLAVAAGRY